MQRLITRFSLIAFCLTVVLTVPAIAQTEETTPQSTQSSQQQGQRHHRRGKLHLTREQRKQMHEIRQSMAKGPERRKAMLAVLTPEQRQQLRARKHHRGQRQGGQSTQGSQTGTAPASSSDELE